MNTDDIDEFNERCNEKLEEFIDSLAEDKRFVYSKCGETGIVLFNHRGATLLERYEDRLYKIGSQKFGSDLEKFIEFSPNNLYEE